MVVPLNVETPPAAARQILGRDVLPHLGFLGALVAIITTPLIAARAAADLIVIVVCGRQAFFTNGVRLADGKHGILSNGAALPVWGEVLLGAVTLAFWVLLVFALEFTAGRLRTVLGRHGIGVTAAARLLGGAALVLAASWLAVSGWGPPLLHPIPLSALVGGVLLIRKGVADIRGMISRYR